MRLSISTIFTVLLSACPRTVTPDTSRFVAPTGVAADIYRLVLDSLGGIATTGPMVVAESTVVFQAPAGVPVTWQDFAAVPAGLPARLEAVSRVPRSSTVLPLPRAVLVLTRAEADAIQQAQPRAWWNEFVRRYPTQRAVFAFSPIAFADDSAAALVEAVSTCGTTCGGGHLVWLERRTATTWVVRRIYPLWVN